MSNSRECTEVNGSTKLIITHILYYKSHESSYQVSNLYQVLCIALYYGGNYCVLKGAFVHAECKK